MSDAELSHLRMMVLTLAQCILSLNNAMRAIAPTAPPEVVKEVGEVIRLMDEFIVMMKKPHG